MRALSINGNRRAQPEPPAKQLITFPCTVENALRGIEFLVHPIVILHRLSDPCGPGKGQYAIRKRPYPALSKLRNPKRNKAAGVDQALNRATFLARSGPRRSTLGNAPPVAEASSALERPG